MIPLAVPMHAIACAVLDSILRDNPQVIDSDGNIYQYKGCDQNSLRLTNGDRGQLKHLTIIRFDDATFTAEVDGGLEQTFNYTRKV